MAEPHAKPYILAVEDDEDDFVLLRDALKEADGSLGIEWVRDGDELFEHLNSGHVPSLILLDLNMPKKDGREALRELRAREDFKRIPVVVLTNSSLQDDILRVYEMGGNSFVRKPGDYSELLTTVRKIVAYWFHAVKLPSQ